MSNDPTRALEMERHLVGGICMSPEMLPTVRGIVEARDFYRPDHRELYTLVCSMADAGERVDLTTVQHEHERRADDG